MKYHFPMLALCLAAVACSRPGRDTAFQWTGEIPPGATVHFRNGAGTIEVRPAGGQLVSVSGSRRWNRGRAADVQFTVSHSGSDYYVCAMWRNSGNCGARGYRGRKFGGFLAMFSLFHRTSDAMADLVANVPANLTVDASTLDGSVKVDGIAAGVTARSTNGNVEATNVGGPLSLVTANGDVRLSAGALRPTDRIDVATTNGSIRAELPSTIDGSFDLSVMNGQIESDLPLAASTRGRVARHLQGQIGSSTRVVKMHSLNGGVFVTTRPTALTQH